MQAAANSHNSAVFPLTETGFHKHRERIPRLYRRKELDAPPGLQGTAAGALDVGGDGEQESGGRGWGLLSYLGFGRG